MRVDIPVQELGFIGNINDLTLTAGDSANNHSAVNSGREVLIMENTDASPHTATIVSVACSHARTGNILLATAATAIGIAGPFPPSLFNQTGSLVNIDLDVSTGVSFAWVAINQQKAVG